MPWNPMRVEQRIGRIDRLGQEHPEIRIVNLHYQTPSKPTSTRRYATASTSSRASSAASNPSSPACPA
ncbi:MAG: hypothetical protein KFB96_17820 [Thiocapsa sp.]|uniref:hypothetical protein n=1 Tax=Thiocapsa sp. TaxID=2024551 RepID=UPI001BCE839D|nr:hypothetical protein [Thiocapsa sp.]QVL47544.1 MAG: hypothetical protein KFB96_17820 [Thiocapsa sp.]